MSKRTISILRHAKAEDGADYATDAERPLAQRGCEDAARMGAYLRAHKLLPDIVLCSSAERTRETLQCMGVILPTILSEKLYLASASEILNQLQQMDDDVKHVMVIGHNPGMHEIVVRLMEDAKDEKDIKRLAQKFPTCALAHLSVDLDSWGDLALNHAILEAYLIGKELPELKEPKRA